MSLTSPSHANINNADAITQFRISPTHLHAILLRSTVRLRIQNLALCERGREQRRKHGKGKQGKMVESKLTKWNFENDDLFIQKILT